jgi:hypothetical protein
LLWVVGYKAIELGLIPLHAENYEMAKATSGFILKLSGPGVSFDRPVSDEIANSIINLVMTGTAAAPSLPVATPAGATALPGSPAPNPGQLAGTTIKQFIATKRPENLYQRVACLAYYLAHASGMSRFKTKDITLANTDAAVSKFSNASLFVNDATTKYGYLSAAGGGTKQITAFGEQVVEALPDRDMVKELHDDHKPRSGGRKKTKKKPK